MQTNHSYDYEPSWERLKLEEFEIAMDDTKDVWWNIKLAVDMARKRYWPHDTLKKAIDIVKERYGVYPKA